MRRVRFVGVRLILFGIVFLGVVTLVTAGLWNALMPAIFGLGTITFWQALGLLVLSRLLFGFGFGRPGRYMRKPRFVRGWKDLTEEERQRFRCAMEPRRPGDAGPEGAA